MRRIASRKHGGVRDGLIVEPAQYALVRPGERYILFEQGPPIRLSAADKDALPKAYQAIQWKPSLGKSFVCSGYESRTL